MDTTIPRVKTRIKGFDSLIEGGLPQGSTTLLEGEPGTGKTIFGLEFLYRGALDGDCGIYVTFEGHQENLYRQAAQFGWNLKALEKKNKIKILSVPFKKLGDRTPLLIKKEINQIKAKRVVVDSLSTLYSIASSYVLYKNKQEFKISQFVSGENYTNRRFLLDLISLLEINDITILFISEKSSHMASATRLSEFFCDGIIQITFDPMGGDFSRSLLVRKMRLTKNNEDIHPLEISDTGIVVHSIK